MRDSPDSDSSPHRSEDDWPVREPAWRDGHTVWSLGLHLDAARRERCFGLLDRDERARADRFLQARDRDRFIASHAALRLVLAGILGADAEALTFRVSAEGRPSLAGRQAGRLDFNLSHSGAYALVAVSTTARIGVDVEVPRPMPDALRIARAHFHPREVEALEAGGPAVLEAIFFACWTAKEAFVKAVGAGLSMPLDSFSVSLPPAPAAILETGSGTHASAWTLLALAPAPGAIGAVAIEAPHATCERGRLRPNWADRPSS